MSESIERPPVVVTIAGSDSSGGAGIQADLKTFTSLSCYGASAITALTAQNTLGVQEVHGTPPDFVKSQIRSILEDFDVQSIKTGMLYDADVVRATVSALNSCYPPDGAPMPHLVCDPVCVSTSGHTLLQDDALDVMIDEVFPLATVITPNVPEAELLLSKRAMKRKIEIISDMVLASRELLSLGARAVLVKGGHIPVSNEDMDQLVSVHEHVKVDRSGIVSENMEVLTHHAPTQSFSDDLVADALCEFDGNITVYVRRRIESTNTHGTGCTLSAAIACELSKGRPLQEAVKIGAAYTHQAIQQAFPLGSGHGPLNHLHNLTHRIIPRPTQTDPFPLTRSLIQGSARTWKEYVEHEFVKQLGAGTLSRERFAHFLRQDYHYLKYYARAYGLLAAKSPSYTAIQSSAQVMLNVILESSMHVSYCDSFGISREELESTPESAATTAYGSYLLDMGLRGDTMTLTIALAACLLGYGEVGLWLRKQAAVSEEGKSWVKLEGNEYMKWIEDYSGEDYQGAVRAGLESIEGLAVKEGVSGERYEVWRQVWERCTSLERGFWDMAMNLS